MEKTVKRQNRISRFNNAEKIILVILLAVLAAYALSLILMFGWAIMSSFKTPNFYRKHIIEFPEPITIENYVNAYSNFYLRSDDVTSRVIGFGEIIMNTLLYAVGCSFLQTLSCCVMAYATAKYAYKLSKIVYTTVIIVMILPIVGSLPSEVFVLKRVLHLYDTMAGSWFMSFNFLGMYYLVFYEFFKSMPKDYNEAAEIDGAGRYTVLLRIVFPLTRNMFFTVMLLKFIVYWNDYQVPLVYMPGHPTLSYAVFRFMSIAKDGWSNVTQKIAGAMLVFLPVFVLFVIFHNKLIGNVTMGGVKE
ncbi:MAG: carbohydrate ABC transporter permease [Clostridia bacterium]|nr:carbohydrate ABC transporter permease [Clostridia bacterium]